MASIEEVTDLGRSMERGFVARFEALAEELAECRAKLADRDEQVRNLIVPFAGRCQHFVPLGDYCRRCGA